MFSIEGGSKFGRSRLKIGQSQRDPTQFMGTRRDVLPTVVLGRPPVSKTKNSPARET